MLTRRLHPRQAAVEQSLAFGSKSREVSRPLGRGCRHEIAVVQMLHDVVDGPLLEQRGTIPAGVWQSNEQGMQVVRLGTEIGGLWQHGSDLRHGRVRR